MHEYNITEALLELALRKADEAGAGRITRLNLALGELSGIVGDCVQQCFEALREGTIARDANLVFEIKPTTLKCRKCRRVFTPANHNWACPDCRETSVEIVSGRECYLESIEVE